MVPLIATASLAVSTALRKRIAESCQRDLSRAFVAWLLEDFKQPVDLLSIAAQAAKREGAGQDFQSVAILGFAADAGRSLPTGAFRTEEGSHETGWTQSRGQRSADAILCGRGGYPWDRSRNRGHRKR
jgi:hypothetical protein